MTERPQLRRRKLGAIAEVIRHDAPSLAPIEATSERAEAVERWRGQDDAGENA
jgi:hypothetical protein